jgi:phospholipid-binding lipoprotein MlaA
MTESHWRRSAALLALAAALTGCAGPQAADPRDPFEKFNRAMFGFNDAVDRVALKPAATAYKRVLPQFVQTGVNNFFGNLADLWTGANNVLQGKPKDGFSDFGRFALNTTVGLLGFVDVASDAGLQKHNEDFGQTLGAWGVPSGPYLMLPLLGPSTVRDTAVLPLDFAGDPWTHKEPVRWRNVGIGVRAIDQRASVLDASNLMEEAALDRYEFIRDGFLQRRESRIFDGDKKAPAAKADEGAGAPPDADAKPAGSKPDADAKPDAEAKPAAEARPDSATQHEDARPAAPAAEAPKQTDTK